MIVTGVSLLWGCVADCFSRHGNSESHGSVWNSGQTNQGPSAASVTHFLSAEMESLLEDTDFYRELKSVLTSAVIMKKNCLEVVSASSPVLSLSESVDDQYSGSMMTPPCPLLAKDEVKEIVTVTHRRLKLIRMREFLRMVLRPLRPLVICRLLCDLKHKCCLQRRHAMGALNQAEELARAKAIPEGLEEAMTKLDRWVLEADPALQEHYAGVIKLGKRDLAKVELAKELEKVAKRYLLVNALIKVLQQHGIPMPCGVEVLSEADRMDGYWLGEELRKQIGAAAYVECSSKTQQDAFDMWLKILIANCCNSGISTPDDCHQVIAFCRVLFVSSMHKSIYLTRIAVTEVHGQKS
eukprot:Gb_36835 [translate_table: standard]